MSETTMTPTIEEREQQLAALRDEHGRTLAAIEQAERELAPAERAREQAQAVYDAARADVGRALAALAPHGMYDTWTEKSAADQQRESDALREAHACFEQADRALGHRLVARNEVDRRRSELAMYARAVEARIEAAERELERAGQATTPARDLLGDLRRRVGLGGPGLPAA